MTAAARASDDIVVRRAASQAKSEPERQPRGVLTLSILGTLALLGIVGLTSLGIWQVHRRAWKLDLIQRVDQRIHAAPVAAPGPPAWPAINKSDDEYRRVRVTGRFRDGANALVQAVTDLGGGFWVITPLLTDDGFTVLVNRGFVPAEQRGAETRMPPPAGAVAVTGLLRITEPKGAFLRQNDPAAGRWYSRDVEAIAGSLNLSGVAPYFIDADAALDGPGQPRGGLTVIDFPNSHLVYAITWFTLALMLAGGTWYVARDEWRIRKKSLPHV